MTITTAIIVTAILLALYYGLMIGYDLYMDKLAKANKDENKEEIFDISDQAADFQTIPVNQPSKEEATHTKFERIIRTGISAEKASRMMTQAAEGTQSKDLENVLFIIQNHQTTHV